MAEFRYQAIYEHPHHEDVEFRKLSSDHVTTIEVGGRQVLKVEPEALSLLAQQAMDDIAHLLRPAHLAQLSRILDDPEASSNDRFVAVELLKNANIAAGRVLPGCQDTGTAIVIGHKGEAVWTGVDDAEWISKGIYDAYDQRNLRYSQMAPLDMVYGEEHRHQSAGTDRAVRGAGRRLRVPLHRQGRRLGQQVLPLSGDEGAAQPRVPAALHRREDPQHRDLRLPALSPGARDRRAFGGVHAQDGEARQHPLPRPPSGQGRCPGARLPRSRSGGEGPEALQRDGHRRPVRRQVLRPRRAGDPAAAARSLLPRRHGRLLLGRPPGHRQDHARGHLPRAARNQSGPVPARGDGSRAGRRGRADRSQPAHVRGAGRAFEVPRRHAAVAERPDGGRPGHRPRQAEGAARPGRGSAPVLQGPRRVLRRTRQAPRRPWRRAPSVLPPRGGWTPTWTSSRATAARW